MGWLQGCRVGTGAAVVGSVKWLKADEERAAEEEAERQCVPWVRQDEEKAAEGLYEEYAGMRW